MKTQKTISELLEFSIINLDKPSGPTSFSAIDNVKKLLKIKKVGHFGTLDPKVTGVLPLALNRACKLSNYFMGQDKEYIGKMYINKEITKKELEEKMNYFIGKIIQKPPVKSRVKRVEREREIKKFKILEIEKNKTTKKGMIVKFHSDVQAGTYIRKLISDLGEQIGGAHMLELRRIRAGIFLIKDSHTIEEIEKAIKDYEKGKEDKLRKILIPAEIIKQIITSTQITEQSLFELLNGKPLIKDHLKNPNKIPNTKLFSVFTEDRFIGIYKKIDSEGLKDAKELKEQKESDIIAKPEFVRS